MERTILSPEDKVMIVETNSSARSLLSEVIKELGYKNIEMMDSVKSALGFLEVERVGWVITPLQGDEPVTALHLIEIISKYEVLSKTRVSLLVDVSDVSVLSKAFELGLLSWHKRPFTKDTLVQEFGTLMERLKLNNFNDALTSAQYLSEYLKGQNGTRSLLSLYQKLYELYPERPEMLVKLAEAHFLNDEPDLGKKILGRAKLLDVPGWQEAAKSFVKNDEPITPDLDIKSCVIVDPDDAVQNKVTEILKKVTTGTIKCFSNGQEALEWCSQNPDVDIVLQEWRLPGLSGPNLLQRLRGALPATLPIVVLSSLVTKQDLPLLSEMGVANIIEKPLREDEFINTLVQTLQQELAPTLPETIERKIHQFLMQNDRERADRLHYKVETDSSYPPGLKKYVGALFAFYDKKYVEAKTLLMDAIQKGAEQVKAFNLLGRTLAQMKDLAGACKCLMRAQELSPKNIERLCEIASVQRDLEQDGAAGKTIEAAKQLDATNAQVAKEETKLAIKTGDVDRARELLTANNTPAAVISEMNNTAVAYITGAQFDRAKTLYEKTIEAIPEDNLALRSRVVYNLALAHARNGQLNEAKAVLERVPSDSKLPILGKVASLHKKINASIKSGKPLDIKTVDVNQVESVDVEGLANVAKAAHVEEIVAEGDTKIRVALSDTKMGEICCFKIFSSLEPIDPRWNVILKNRPNFKLRAAIERQDSMGVERMNR